MKPKVAVIYGGRSGEHEISVRSARSVLGAINRDRYEVREIFITPGGKWEPQPILPEPDANPDIDVAFPVLHGTFGEDGAIQGLLEMADIPYVGSGVLGSSAAMDKEVTKRLCQERGLPVVEWVTLWRSALDASKVEDSFSYPVFVKPANLGSSVGISKAHNSEELDAAMKLAASYDRKIIVERAIVGRELECAVIGNEDPAASAPCEILPSQEFYDYDDKYLLNATRIQLPAELDAGMVERIRRLAIASFKAVGCEGMARVDFLLENETGRLYLNEINTIPGFTSISMYPKMWEHSGVPYPELIDQLIELALARHAVKSETRYTR
jgi:D-alanine-D-alanine ligase